MTAEEAAPESQAAPTRNPGEAPPDIPAALENYTELPFVVAATKGMGLNLREGPGSGYGVLAILPEGAAVTALSLPFGAEVPGWALAATDQGMGWVRREYLAALED